MSKSANPGELRTPVLFKHIVRGTDSMGFPVEEEKNVFGEGREIRVKWVNAHGTEVFTSMQLELREPATVTMRYSPKITEQCLVYKKGDSRPFEIISMDNVEERGRWLELKVQRKVDAR